LISSFICGEAALCLSSAAKQTTSSTTVFRVALEDLSSHNHLKNFIESDVFLDHLLLGVLRNADLFRAGQLPQAILNTH